jgi:hypothetical protein
MNNDSHFLILIYVFLVLFAVKAGLLFKFPVLPLRSSRPSHEAKSSYVDFQRVTKARLKGREQVHTNEGALREVSFSLVFFTPRVSVLLWL